MNKLLSSFLISTLIVTTSPMCFADTTPVPVKAFTVNPETIRGRLLSKNISLREALNNVESSKLNVSMARAKLLPSLNLAVLLPALANPTFLLASVTFLFPFLVPSNWAVLKQEKELFESDKASYKALQLNVLSNALTVYYTYLNDAKVQKVYADQSVALGTLYANLKKQSDLFGNVAPEDLGMASAQWEESRNRVSKLQELLIAELAGVRTMLGLPLGTTLTVADADLAPTDYENKSVIEIAQRSLDGSPEVMQLSYLVKAAQAGKWAKVFGFMSSATMAGTTTSSNDPVFGNLKAGGAFTFGVDNLVNIKIANNNLALISLRVQQLTEENERLAEVLSGQIAEVKSQQALTTSALNDRLAVYEAQKKQYVFGLISLQTLLQTQVQLTDTYVSNIKSDLDLKMQRLTLERLVIDGDFGKVKGCVAVDQSNVVNKGLFHKKTQSLDELCQN